MLNAGLPVRPAWMTDTGCWILDVRGWLMNAGPLSLLAQRDVLRDVDRAVEHPASCYQPPVSGYARASVKSLSRNMRRFQVEICGTT